MVKGVFRHEGTIGAVAQEENSKEPYILTAGHVLVDEAATMVAKGDPENSGVEVEIPVFARRRDGRPLDSYDDPGLTKLRGFYG